MTRTPESAARPTASGGTRRPKIGPIVALLFCAGCTMQPLPPRSSLYDRLGGQPGISFIVSGLVTNITKDPRLTAYFSGIDPARKRLLMIEQLCAGTGGPCVYTGRSIFEAHKELHISEQAYEAFLSDLRESLVQAGVAPREQQELIDLLTPMRPDVIGG